MADSIHPNSVMLTCRDTGKSVAFYRDVLGFQVKECWPDEQQPMWANLVRDGQSIMLCGVPATDAEIDGCSHGSPQRLAYWKKLSKAFNASTSPGVGVHIYIGVDDVDTTYERFHAKGAKPLLEPTSQFYGIRDFVVADPSGYHLCFYMPIKLASCQSCGMPLQDAPPGEMYCSYCTDEKGQLRPYESVLEGTISGYFMAMQKLPRKEAETAARAHLAQMPAWASRT